MAISDQPFADPNSIRQGGYAPPNPYDMQKNFFAQNGSAQGRYLPQAPNLQSQGVGALIGTASSIPRKPGLSGLPYQGQEGAPIAGQGYAPQQSSGEVPGQGYTPQQSPGSAPQQGYNGSLPPSPAGPNDNYRGSGNNPYAYGGFNYNQDYGQQRYQYR